MSIILIDDIYTQAKRNAFQEFRDHRNRCYPCKIGDMSNCKTADAYRLLIRLLANKENENV